MEKIIAKVVVEKLENGDYEIVLGCLPVSVGGEVKVSLMDGLTENDVIFAYADLTRNAEKSTEKEVIFDVSAPGSRLPGLTAEDKHTQAKGRVEWFEIAGVGQSCVPTARLNLVSETGRLEFETVFDVPRLMGIQFQLEPHLGDESLPYPVRVTISRDEDPVRTGTLTEASPVWSPAPALEKLGSYRVHAGFEVPEGSDLEVGGSEEADLEIIPP